MVIFNKAICKTVGMVNKTVLFGDEYEKDSKGT